MRGIHPRGGGAGYALVLGGAGFIGSNLAHRLAAAREPVVVADNLSRPGTERNVFWLRKLHGPDVVIELADVRDADAIGELVAGASSVYHLAAQVAVTTSLSDPLHDFAVNAQGTLTILEALRRLKTPPPLVFASTNKVYGTLDGFPMRGEARRYVPADPELLAHGVDERLPLQFCSPYGCSKGAADQYVLDYARSFGLPATVLRLSCVYGPRQLGTEDQGWVAHFLASARAGRAITIFGDGRQVRDVLFIDDLVEALLLVRRHLDRLAGEAFNVGGGAANTVSVLELLDRIEALDGYRPETRFAPSRPADQLYYASDIRRLEERIGWHPRTGVATGIGRLRGWLRSPPESPASRSGGRALGGDSRRTSA